MMHDRLMSLREALCIGLALCLLAISSVCHAADPEFKGFRFGSTTYSEWKTTVTEYDDKSEQIAPGCHDAEPIFDPYLDDELGTKSCSWYNAQGRMYGGGVDVGQAETRRDVWIFLDDVLAIFSASMNVGQLRNLLPPLRAKYGAPTSTRSEVLENAFGAQFTNKIYQWILPGMTIVVTKYDDSTEESSIRIFNPDLAAELDRRRKAKPADTSGL